jgi:hypothetical protein
LKGLTPPPFKAVQLQLAIYLKHNTLKAVYNAFERCITAYGTVEKCRYLARDNSNSKTKLIQKHDWHVRMNSWRADNEVVSS